MTALTVEEATEALTKAAFTVTNPDMSDHGRTLIHCYAGPFGTDWDLDAAIGLLAGATSIEWTRHLVRHDLRVVGGDGKVRYFDVEWPERNGPPTKVVPADAIVLERPTAETRDFLATLGYVFDGNKADSFQAEGGNVHYHRGWCEHCGQQSIDTYEPAEALGVAAHLALAADEAERGQG